MAKFKGHDWRELTAALRCAKKSDSDSKALETTCEALGMACGKRLVKTAGVVREFLSALAAADHTFRAPLWKGLRKIKDDATLLRYSRKLLSDMWT